MSKNFLSFLPWKTGLKTRDLQLHPLVGQKFLHQTLDPLHVQCGSLQTSAFITPLPWNELPEGSAPLQIHCVYPCFSEGQPHPTQHMLQPQDTGTNIYCPDAEQMPGGCRRLAVTLTLQHPQKKGPELERSEVLKSQLLLT